MVRLEKEKYYNRNSKTGMLVFVTRIGVPIRHVRRKGFVTILALMLITLVGGAMLILSHGANTLAFETNRAYYQACERNLAASGFAWAGYQNVHKKTELPTQPIELDVELLQIPQGSLTVSFAHLDTDDPSVEVKTTCGRETNLLKRLREYSLK
ncbi:MAG: hypothetical protein AMJ79_08280 [Phycisphaerae bacterium SM23_30]|nr:MAG: hypothetical protein AMJ79_08280 [Phycisphaerae bacterium SM23_30]